jgi:hypothetical protein
MRGDAFVSVIDARSRGDGSKPNGEISDLYLVFNTQIVFSWHINIHIYIKFKVHIV